MVVPLRFSTRLSIGSGRRHRRRRQRHLLSRWAGLGGEGDGLALQVFFVSFFFKLISSFLVLMATLAFNSWERRGGLYHKGVGFGIWCSGLTMNEACLFYIVVHRCDMAHVIDLFRTSALELMLSFSILMSAFLMGLVVSPRSPTLKAMTDLVKR